VVYRSLAILGAFAALNLVALAQPAKLDDQTAVQVEALNRLKGADLESNAALKTAVLRVLEKTRGTPQFVEIVRDFSLKGQADALLDYATKYPAEASAIEAFRLAVTENGVTSLPTLLDSTNAPAVVQLMANTKDKSFDPVLKSLVQDSAKPLPVRQAAVKALAQSESGARFLLDLAQAGNLPADLKPAAASELNLAPWPDIKKLALEIVPLPAPSSAESLPPISELIQRAGNIQRGRTVFESDTSACIYCHIVNGRGTDVGPQLSEIGTKLGKEALYQAILDPSSGISFGFEAWSITTKSDDELFGMITSETADELTVKSQTGILTKVKKSDIATRQKLSSSLMPQGLHLTMSTQDLIDLVEYLSSLKKAP
jgi:putative heme-binding domain-containing protein